MKDWRVFFSSFLAVLLCLCSCFSPKQPRETLRINLPEKPMTMDPRKGGDIYSSALHFFLFEGLTRVLPDSSVDYGIANRIDISDDGLTYTFHLRDTQWSNHLPVTAGDFEYAWKCMLDPNFPCPNANLLYPILYAEEAKKKLISVDKVGVYALDPKTLVVRLKSPTPYFLKLISFCVFFPVCKAVVEKNPSWADRQGPSFVTNGPYNLKIWKHEILLTKNPLFWGQEKVSTNDIHISFVSSENTAFEMFKNKELDLLGSPYTNIPLDAGNHRVSREYLQSFPIGKTLFCTFNMNHPVLSNRHIRKALSLSLDREAIVKAIGILGEQPAANFVAPVLKGHVNKKLMETFNPVKAKEYLDEGLKELGLTKACFEKIPFSYSNQEYSLRLAQIIQQQWFQSLGITVPLEGLDHKFFIDKLNRKEYAMAHYYCWAQYDDPVNILDRFKKKDNPKNYPAWENKDYIQLVDLSAYLRDEDRDLLLDQAEKILLEEMPLTPLLHATSLRMLQPYIQETTPLEPQTFIRYIPSKHS